MREHLKFLPVPQRNSCPVATSIDLFSLSWSWLVGFIQHPHTMGGADGPAWGRVCPLILCSLKSLHREDVHKVDIMTFCQQKAAQSRKSETPESRDAALLWQLLVLLCRQNGVSITSLMGGQEQAVLKCKPSWDKYNLAYDIIIKINSKEATPGLPNCSDVSASLPTLTFTLPFSTGLGYREGVGLLHQPDDTPRRVCTFLITFVAPEFETQQSSAGLPRKKAGPSVPTSSAWPAPMRMKRILSLSG